MTNIHAIILARGNSKEIKNKNLTKVNSKPLIYWSIKNALNSKKIDHVWVSSDSSRILNCASKYKAKIIKRPMSLSLDNSSSDLAWLHAVKKIQKKFKIDYIVGIQPTSPIRDKDDFDRAISFYFKNKFDSVFSCCELKDYLVWKTKGKKLIPNYKKRNVRQKIKTQYLENGSFYIFSKKNFIKKKIRLFGKIGNFIQSKLKSFQIDTHEDLFIVNTLMGKLKNDKK